MRLKKLTTPVIFRLLYSTGMRTNEARLLGRTDVNLKENIISIRQTKGDQQRYVVMHPTLIPILRHYDSIVDGICPDREFFFPSPRGGSLSNTWLKDVFREMWDKENASHATAYELRHHYAISNINRWQDMGFELYDHLLYLSKSMGHLSVESTRGYYAIVPALADTLKAKAGKDTDWMLPDV
jgi:integrase